MRTSCCRRVSDAISQPPRFAVLTHISLFPSLPFLSCVLLPAAIDYLQDLLADRQGLLARLQRARGALPHGHPALMPPHTDEIPLWEREWTGGQNANDDEGDGSDDEE